METKKVLQVFGSLDMGGAETMMVNVLRSLPPGECRFDFVVSGDEAGYYEDEIRRLGCKVIHITKRSRSVFRHHLDFYRAVKDGGYQIIHFHTENAFLTSMQAVMARLGGAKRLVVHSHNTMDWRNGRLVFLSRLFRGILYRQADVRLSCGREASIWLYGTEKNVTVIPIPVACGRFRFDEKVRDALRKREDLESKQVYLHVGRFDTVKNHRFLMDIFREIKELDRNSVLFLAGSGRLKKSIQQQAMEYGLDYDVVFLGDISDVDRKFQMADVFLLPSKYEGFPTVVLEAQASGLPCYISDTITSDVILTDLVRQIPLKKSAEEWARIITGEKGRKRKNRDEYNQAVREKYDVSITAAKLLKEYFPDRKG